MAYTLAYTDLWLRIRISLPPSIIVPSISSPSPSLYPLQIFILYTLVNIKMAIRIHRLVVGFSFFFSPSSYSFACVCVRAAFYFPNNILLCIHMLNHYQIDSINFDKRNLIGDERQPKWVWNYVEQHTENGRTFIAVPPKWLCSIEKHHRIMFCVYFCLSDLHVGSSL